MRWSCIINLPNRLTPSENGVYRRQLGERSLAGWRAVSRLQGYGAPVLLNAINGLLYSPSRSLNVLFRRIVTSHHARISPTAKLAAFLRAETDIPYCRQIAEMCDAEEVSRTFNPGFIAN